MQCRRRVVNAASDGEEDCGECSRIFADGIVADHLIVNPQRAVLRDVAKHRGIGGLDSDGSGGAIDIRAQLQRNVLDAQGRIIQARCRRARSVRHIGRGELICPAGNVFAETGFVHVTLEGI